MAPGGTWTDPTSLLVQLIDVADRMLNRGAASDPHFETLAAAVVAARAEPAPRIVDDEAAMLVAVLRRLRRCSAAQALPWAMIGAALLPLVRDALARAIEDRRSTMLRPDPEAQPNYRGRRP